MKITLNHTLSRSIAVLGLVITVLVAPVQGHAVSPDVCTQAANASEKKARLPVNLLTAIALKETGRWDGNAKQSYAWPWTVTAEGKGNYHASKADALAHIRQLKARGVSNIDVGCFQINLHYHPQAFSDMSQALDPTANATYAGRHLKQLREDHGSWHKAVARYHSGNPARGQRYAAAVYDLKAVARNQWRRNLVARSPKTRLTKRQKLRLAMHSDRTKRDASNTKSRADRSAASDRSKAGYQAHRARVLADWDAMIKRREQRRRAKRGG
ncbi:MAG: transglycosylase SLT domain-containing protein [Rhodospirillaceae bacterium]|nr:transglycosylase SLT domain-containing protein [Rhodospirillaceae bacterium]